MKPIIVKLRSHTISCTHSSAPGTHRRDAHEQSHWNGTGPHPGRGRHVGQRDRPAALHGVGQSPGHDGKMRFCSCPPVNLQSDAMRNCTADNLKHFQDFWKEKVKKHEELQAVAEDAEDEELGLQVWHGLRLPPHTCEHVCPRIYCTQLKWPGDKSFKAKVFFVIVCPIQVMRIVPVGPHICNLISTRNSFRVGGVNVLNTLDSVGTPQTRFRQCYTSLFRMSAKKNGRTFTSSGPLAWIGNLGYAKDYFYLLLLCWVVLFLDYSHACICGVWDHKKDSFDEVGVNASVIFISHQLTATSQCSWLHCTHPRPLHAASYSLSFGSACTRTSWSGLPKSLATSSASHLP